MSAASREPPRIPSLGMLVSAVCLCQSGRVKAPPRASFGARVTSHLRQHLRRFLRWREAWAPSEELLHLLLAGGVGVLGGLVNLVFYYAIQWAQLWFLHDSRDPVVVAEVLGPLGRLLMPAVGGLLAGLVLQWGLTAVGRTGTSNLLEAVVAGDGRLRLRNSLVKAASSLVSIGTGAPVGREGGIVQMAAVLASKWGQLGGWEPYRVRLMVGCGAAAGIAAAYNAPISGAVFAATVVLGNFSMNLFGPLVFASVIATVLSRSFFGIHPWYDVPPFDVTSLTQLPWFVLLGALAGVLAGGFLKALARGEEMLDHFKLPLWGRLAVGGIAVGLLTLAWPQIWGNGYVVTNRILHGEFPAETSPLLWLAGLLLAKLVASVVAVSSGMVGGVFTPTLFLGAALGSLGGTLLHQFNLAQDIPTAAFGLVGMGAMLAGTTRSPLLAMIMVFEISLNYSLMPALMLGCAVATLVAGRLGRVSIYTAELQRRGLELEPELIEPGAGVERTVGDLMRDPVPPVQETARLAELGARFLKSPSNFLPVVNPEGRLTGMVALHDLKPYLNESRELGLIAHDVMRPPPLCLTPQESLFEALPAVLASELRNIPVVNSRAEMRLVGTLVRAEVVGRLAEVSAPGRRLASRT
jgi:CIC family chloride channel protein